MDHLLPESLDKNAARFAEVRASHGIKEDFKIQSYYNFAPSCHPCNTDKGDRILEVGQLGILLAKVRDKVPELEVVLTAKRQAHELGILLRDLALGMSEGTYSESEVIAGLSSIGLPLNLTHQAEISRTPAGIILDLPFSEGKSIRWTNHTVEHISRHKINPGMILNSLRSGIKQHGQYNKVAEYARRYYVDTADGMRVVYDVTEDSVAILTCFYQSKK